MRRPHESRFAVPYPGPDSFQAEDADLFFGREREAEQLIAMILSARCTLLHAQSGAGKTSLLNAVVIPRLEARGHSPIRILPQDDPIEAVRVATLHHLLPPPWAEVAALERARQALGLGTGDTLGQLLRHFDQLSVSEADGLRPATSREQTKRRLVAPIEEPAPAGAAARLALAEFGTVMPYLCRVLRGSVEVGTYGAYLAAVSPRTAAGALTEDAPLGGIRELFEDPRLVSDYGELLESLYLPIPGLRPFFENLFHVFAQRRRTGADRGEVRWRRLSPVLIIDQFEELFTRFVDRGRRTSDHEAPSWRLRWQFFRELESLYADPGDGSPEVDSSSHGALLPIRLVISIRNEFVAQLDPIRRFVPGLGRSTFHLGLLGKEDAEVAIREPAARYGVGYSRECVERIVDQLAREERYVEPPYVQIVCDRLWHNRGAALAAGEAEGEIGVEHFQALGETEGILDRFFQDFLAELQSDDERLEALEMLERLITASGTRNIVARDELASAPFRRPELREDLLTRLQNGNVVRIERRVGTHFVEITHEFLIASIQKAIRLEITRDARYRDFLTALESIAKVKLGGELREERRELLGLATLGRLEAHESRLRWGYLGTEAMLRSTILAGGDEAAVRRWSRRFRDGDPMWDAERLLAGLPGSGQKRRLLADDELEAVRAAEAEGRLDPRGLEPYQRELVLRSILVMAAAEDRDQVAKWTREVMRHGA
ncbi:MAG: hypothetical protein V3T72_12135 [Thermoanaerobaculia bacterium]